MVGIRVGFGAGKWKFQCINQSAKVQMPGGCLFFLMAGGGGGGRVLLKFLIDWHII